MILYMCEMLVALRKGDKEAPVHEANCIILHVVSQFLSGVETSAWG